MLEMVGSHWLHPDRTLFAGRATFSVELVYLHDPQPGFDLKAAHDRVEMCLSKGAKVALRIDFAHQQALPPDDDGPACADYVRQCQDLATREKLRDCTWFICGNEPNLAFENRVTQRAMSPEWVARVVFGHGRPPSETDNVYQFVHTVNPGVQVLLPAIAPYSPEGSGQAPMPANFPPGSTGRSSWAPWEHYQYALFRAAYDNNSHTPTQNIKSALHAYGNIGADGTLNGGRDEPGRDVREEAFGAQFGSRWVGDALYLFREAQAAARGTRQDPAVLITECSTVRSQEAAPINNYASGWWLEMAHYANSLPRVMGLAAFCDQDYGNNFLSTAMSGAQGRLGNWDADHNQLLEHGWS